MKRGPDDPTGGGLSDSIKLQSPLRTSKIRMDVRIHWYSTLYDVGHVNADEYYLVHFSKLQKSTKFM